MGTLSDAIGSWSSIQPDKPAIVHSDGSSLSYVELDELVTLIAGNLYSRLLRIPGYGTTLADGQSCPPMLLITNDSLHSVATVLAINVLGLTVAPMNPRIGSTALCAAKEAIQGSVVLYDDANSDTAELLEAQGCHPVLLADLWREPEPLPQRVEYQADFPFLLSLSSGSTGDPKPVIYTDSGKLQRAIFTAREFGFDQRDTLLCASPFFHSLGQRLTFMPLVLGSTLVLLPRFTAESWLNAVEQFHVSVTICVSSHLLALKDLLIDHDPRARTIRSLVSSSASIDPVSKAHLFDNGEFNFYEMYGASEVATATRLGPDDDAGKRESVGRACEDVSLKIVDNEHRSVAPNVIGEIHVRSPLCSPGYYHRTDLDATAFNNGWFRTGDLGYLDDDGFLYFVDRTSDVIISGGSNTYPSDVEASLRSYAGVSDCLVVGVTDTYLGEAPIAIVVPERPVSATLERDLRQHVRTALAPSQQPMLYFFVDELPLNGAGKIDRKNVRKHYNDLGLDPTARFRQALMSKASA